MTQPLSDEHDGFAEHGAANSIAGGYSCLSADLLEKLMQKQAVKASSFHQS